MRMPTLKTSTTVDENLLNRLEKNHVDTLSGIAFLSGTSTSMYFACKHAASASACGASRPTSFSRNHSAATVKNFVVGRHFTTRGGAACAGATAVETSQSIPFLGGGTLWGALAFGRINACVCRQSRLSSFATAKKNTNTHIGARNVEIYPVYPTRGGGG